MRQFHPLLLFLLAVGCLTSLVISRAFADGPDFPITPGITQNFTIDETYKDYVRDIDGVATLLNKSFLKITATASMSGIPLATITGSSTVSLVANGVALLDSVPLANADVYTEGGTTATFLLNDETDPVTGDYVPGGYVSLTWDVQKVRVFLSGTAQDAYSPLLVIADDGSYHGSEGFTQDVAVPVYFSFAGYELDNTSYLDIDDNLTGSDLDVGDLYQTKATGGLDLTAPKVSFSASTPSKVLNPTITLAGTASDNIAVDQVYLQVNSGSFAPVGPSEFWQAQNVQLVAGDNTIRVYAQDQNLNVSSTVSRKITYSPSSTLYVTVVGQGSVSPDVTGTSSQETNATVTLNSVPAIGWSLSSWTVINSSGTFTSTDSSVSFTQLPNTSVTATFILGPFAPISGAFRGTVQPPIVTPKKCGVTSVSVAGDGAVRGKLNLAGKDYTVDGAFDTSGYFSQTIKRGTKSPIKLTLNADLVNFQEVITGKLEGKGLDSNVTLYRLATSASTRAGSYTVILPADPVQTSEKYPQGSGWATAFIASDGDVTLDGALADGTPFSITSNVSTTGIIPVYANLPKGVLVGDLTLANIPGVSDLSGPLTWRRLPDKAAKNFAGGFLTTLNTAGAKYSVPPNGARITGTASTIGITLDSGGLLAPLARSGNVGTDNSVTITDAGTEALSFTFDPAHGTYTGTFLVNGKTITLQGAFLQKSNTGSGYFLNGKKSGAADVQAP